MLLFAVVGALFVHIATSTAQPGIAATRGPAAGDVETAAESSLPSGASGDWWRRVQRGLAATEYHPSRNAKGLQAPNRAHNLRTYFGARGIRLHDRTAVGGPELAGLSLVGTGRGTALAPVAAGTVTQAGRRVEIRRAGIVEWYENTPRGLEQGFTLAARARGEGALVLKLSVEHARARLMDKSIELATDSGRRLRYGKLIATDATGRILPSRLEAPSPDRLRLVVDDTAASYPVVIDPLITEAPDTILESNQPGPLDSEPPAFGWSVSGAGDVNGDGFADVIVGAWGWDGGDSVEGAAFVFLGRPGGIVDAYPLSAHAWIESGQAQARLGWSVSGAGDVNGDGFDDIVVGAYLYRSTGAAFVFYGSASGIGANSPFPASPLDADASIFADQLGSFFAFSVAGAGDVNNDGFGDIIVGAPLAGSGNPGAAVVFHGSPAGITGTGFGDADAVLIPNPADQPATNAGLLGGAVAAAGDVNGDGFADVIVTSGDTAVVFLGSPTGLEGNHPGDAHAVVTLDAATSMTSVAGAGDVNGDGFDDIIMGARFYPIQSPTTQEGAAFVFLGSALGIPSTGTSQAHAAFFGNLGAEWLGITVAGVGDVNGDGFDEVAIAARVYPGSLDGEGVAHVFLGGPDGIVAGGLADAFVRLAPGQSRASIHLDTFSASVAGAGDVDGDGFADVILGAPFYDAGDEDEGATFVYLGGSTPAILNQPPVPVAGPDQVVFDLDDSGSATVRVDGRASFDPDGFIVSNAWFEGETLLGTSPVLTTSLAGTGDHIVVLTVTDNDGTTRGDPVTIRVEGASSANVTADAQHITAPPTVDSFTASPATITAGGSATLSWTTTGATDVSIDNGVGAVAVDGSVTVTPAVTTTYTLTATSAGGTATASASVTVNPAPPTVDSLAASPSTITAGETTTLSWRTTGATSALLSIEGVGVVTVAVDGSVPVSPSATTAYVLTATSTEGTATASTIVTVRPAEALTITRLEFRANRNEWRIEGTSSIPGPDNTMTLYTGPTAPGPVILGTAAVDGLGVWDFRERQSSVAPDSTGTISILSSQGGKWEGISGTGPADPSGDPPPTVDSFTAAPATITAGETTTLSWTTTGATDVSIDNGVGVVAVDGSVTVTPTATTTYTLTATGAGGTATSSATVTVNPAPPTVDSFTAAPTTITAGETTTLSWTTSGATGASIDNDVGAVAVDGNVTVSPTATTTYTLTATGAGGTATSSATVTVNPAPPTVDSFTAAATTITAGETTTLSWTTSGATGVSIDNDVGAVAVDGNVTVSPTATTIYTLTATGAGGTATSSATVTVNPAPPTVDSFTAAATTITAGETTTLSWATTGATDVSIDNGVGAVAVDGNVTVTPTATTTYTLTATGAGGTATAVVVVTVNPPPPTVDSFTVAPATITVGETTTLSWTTTGAAGVSIDNGVGPAGLDGSITVSPTATTTYTLTGTGTGGTATAVVAVTVNPPPPSVDSFTVTPATITAGETTTLSWATTAAIGVSIDNGVGPGAVDGSVTVSPTVTTTYTLTATGTGGAVTAVVAVTVNPPPPTAVHRMGGAQHRPVSRTDDA